MALYGRVERPECIACGLCQMLAPALLITIKLALLIINQIATPALSL